MSIQKEDIAFEAVKRGHYKTINDVSADFIAGVMQYKIMAENRFYGRGSKEKIIKEMFAFYYC